VVLTRTPVLRARSAVTVAPVTRTIRGIASEVPLWRAQGLRARSVASCDNLQTIPKAALGATPIGRLDVPKLVELDVALRYALGIGPG